MNPNLNLNLNRAHSEPEPPLLRNLNRGHAISAVTGLAAGVLCRLLPDLATRALIGAAVLGIALVALGWAARRIGLFDTSPTKPPS
jgi:uncharacterized protein (DUF2062 family)